MTPPVLRRTWRSPASCAWLVYLCAGGLLCLLYVLVPPFRGSGPVMNLLGLSPVIAILAGIHMHRPASPGPWRWFALGFALFWFGDLYTYSYPLLVVGEVPFPSLGDAAYLLVYPALVAGLVMIVRRRRAQADSGRLIDGLILTVGLTLPSWVALIAPYVRDDTLSLVAKTVSVAYPVADVVLLAAAIPLALDAGRREPAFYLVSSSILLLLVTDFVYGMLTLHGVYTHQLWLDAGWLGFYLLWGAAALHPSMARLQQKAARSETVLTRFRLALLSGAVLIAPAFELANDIRRADFEMAVVTASSAALFGLVVLRMAGLVRQQERSLERERTLSSAGSALVGSTGQEDIEEVAVGAARALAGPGSAAAVVAAGELPRLSEDAGDSALVRLDDRLRAELGLSDGQGSAFALKMSPRRGEPAVLVVAGPTVTGAAVQAALRALATQIALALDGAALSQEVHRRQSEARFGSLVQHSSDLITVIDADGVISYQSPSIERVLGHLPDDVLGRPLDDIVEPGDRLRLMQLVAGAAAGSREAPQAIECTLVHRDGERRQFEVLMTNLMHDQHVGGIVLNARDVSERRAFEAQLTHQAFHDAVTGLANRALFTERVRHAITRSRREDRGCAVLFLDLDDFKEINDSLGHAAGDEVLIEVARRLDANIRGLDTAARFGGDEFAVLLEDIQDSQEAIQTAERVFDALTVPFQVGHKALALRGSLGISVLPAGGESGAEEMIRDADAAMYIAKRDGKGGHRLFEPEMHEGVLSRLELRADLQRAITAGQLELHYQPIVRLETGAVAGVEALLRWNHPERGTVPPDQFVPLAEETGLIVPLGRWVLREGCAHARRMAAAMPGHAPTMSINLSLRQIHQSDIVADVRDALADSGLEPERLTLEITETVLMADAEQVVDRLRDLKALGVRLALDDFGTGYSSLSYLSRFPVDVLKMDRSFLRADASQETSDLANAVVALGASLDLEVVAEGIELPEQWDKLRELGCDLGQGYLFARPMNGDDSLAFLARAAAPSLDAA